MTGWRRGRGLLGPLQPLLGSWHNVSEDERPASRAPCLRTFEPALQSGFVRLDARWNEAPGSPAKAYQELCLFGRGDSGTLTFWAFTSDGKRSTGAISDGSDVHPQAIAFEAQMPAGLARQIYWPDDAGGFFFAVEAAARKGWNRFLLHHYRTLGRSG